MNTEFEQFAVDRERRKTDHERLMNFEHARRYLFNAISITMEDMFLLDDIKQSILVFAMKDVYGERNNVSLNNMEYDFRRAATELQERHPAIAGKLKIIRLFMDDFYFNPAKKYKPAWKNSEDVYYDAELDDIIKRDMSFVPYTLKECSRREVGKTYWDPSTKGGKGCSWYRVTKARGKDAVDVLWGNDITGTLPDRFSKNVYGCYELKPFESLECFDRLHTRNLRELCRPVNSDKSYTGAEIRALCCAGCIGERISNTISFEYYQCDGCHPLNETVYYYVWDEIDYKGYPKVIIQRDTDKSPRPVKKMRD